MKQRKKWVLLLILLILLSGCGNQNNVQENTADTQGPLQVKNRASDNVDRKTGQQIAEHLVKLSSSVPGVIDATAVVIGSYAIVGIDVDKDLDRSNVGTIKYTVAEALKHDPHGANAVIIADPDVTARLREIQEDIQKGEPIEGIMDELAEITGRLMPEIPADITDPVRKDSTKNHEQQLNEQEKRKMEKQQEEQSNHHMN